jgi:hypothetical protein
MDCKPGFLASRQEDRQADEDRGRCSHQNSEDKVRVGLDAFKREAQTSSTAPFGPRQVVDGSLKGDREESQSLEGSRHRNER